MRKTFMYKLYAAKRNRRSAPDRFILVVSSITIALLCIGDTTVYTRDIFLPIG